MTAHQERIDQLFLAALGLLAPDREAFLRSRCPEEPEIVAEVQALLRASREVAAGHLEQHPGLALFTHLLGTKRDDPAPSQLGHYRIECEIGRGGMGRVFRAWDARLQRLVAIKMLPPTASLAPEARARFEREVAALGQLRHPHVVAALHADAIGSCHFLVMEYVDGQDLQHLIDREGPLPPARACALIRQAALGLQHLHDKGIVHRDVKPSNLLLAGDGTVKLLDLGIALLQSASGAGPSLTGTGVPLGTVDYMAPEQQEGHGVGARADVYGLGCTLYFLLTGRAPFGHHQGLARKLLAHQTEEPPPVPGLRASPLEGVLRRMLAKEPAERFATPTEVIQALDATSAVAPPVPPPLSVPLGWTRALLAGFTLLFVVGLCGAALVLRQATTRRGNMGAPLEVVKFYLELTASLFAVAAGLAGGFLVVRKRLCLVHVLLGALALAFLITGWSSLRWLATGEKREQTTEAEPELRQVFGAMDAHLKALPEDRQRRQRFFWLPASHSDPSAGRAALEEVLGNLRGTKERTGLQPVGEGGRLFVVPLADMGWDEDDHWQELTARDPYALTYFSAGDVVLRARFESVAARTGERVPLLRADWFVVALATEPALYARLRHAEGRATIPAHETIAKVRERYAGPLGPQAVAGELSLPDDRALFDRLDPATWDRLGLSPLLRQQPISRASWSALHPDGTSTFQKLAGQLQLGTPRRPRTDSNP